MIDAEVSTAPMPRPKRSVLIVCTANQCRSAMAEGIVRAQLERAGRTDVHVGSAGTWAEAGVPATRDAIKVMAEREIDISAHRSREVSAPLIAAADLVLVMTRGHREAIEAEGLSKNVPLRLFSELGGASHDILDPVGQGPSTYRATADELSRLIEAGWNEIVGDQESSAR